MAFILAAIVVLIPLILTPGLFLYYDVTPKIIILLVGTAAAALVAFFRRTPAAPGWLTILLAAQAISLALSTLLSSDRALSYAGTNWRRFGLVTQCSMLLLAWLIAAWVAKNPSRALWLLRATCAAGSLAAVYGILQYFGWDPWIPPQAYHMGEEPFAIVRPPGTLGHAGYFANYLLFAVFAGIALRLCDTVRAWSWFGVFAAVLSSAAILLSGTRGALIGLAAGAAFLLIWFRPRLGRRALAWSALAVVAVADLYLSPAGRMLRSRVHWVLEEPLGGARFALWRDSLSMGMNHWAAGWGPETFSANFPRYQSPALARAFPDFYYESPHNMFLDALAAQGILGLGILIALAILGFVAARRAPAEDRRWAGVLAAALLAILVTHQFYSFVMPTAFCFYLTVAVLAQWTKPLSFPAPRLSRAWAWAAVPACIVFLVFAVQLFEGDRSLARVDHSLRARAWNQAIDQYEHARRWLPWGVNADLWYSNRMAVVPRQASNFLDGVRAMQHGLQAAVRATEQSEDRHNAWYNLAQFYADENDLSLTERSLRTAASWAPNWFKPHWMLARVLNLQGRVDDARAEARRAVELDNGRDAEVLQTLRQLSAPTPVTKK